MNPLTRVQAAIGIIPACSLLCAGVLGIIGMLDERFWRDLFPLSLLALPVVVLAKAMGLLVPLVGTVWGLVAFLRCKPDRSMRRAAALLALASLLTAIGFVLWLSTQPPGAGNEQTGVQERAVRNESNGRAHPR